MCSSHHVPWLLRGGAGLVGLEKRYQFSGPAFCIVVAMEFALSGRAAPGRSCLDAGPQVQQSAFLRAI